MSSQGFAKNMTPPELIAELAALSKAEKAEVLERLAQEIGNAWLGIEKTSGVVGGAAADLVHAWGYVDVHRQEIDEAIRQNEAA